MSTDALSDVLQTIRLTGAVFFHVDAAAPWVAEAPHSPLIAQTVMRGVQHLISYHVVTRGACWAGLIGERPVQLLAGDIIVFPQGDPHVVSSEPGMRTDPRMNSYTRAPNHQLPFTLRYGSDGPPDLSIVCGFLGCDVRPFNPLLATLPRLMHVPLRSQPSSPWLRHLVDAAVSESLQKRHGGESVLARLSELMFVEVVRRHIESLPHGQRGWLAGLRDPFVGRALALMHDRPEHPWTLEELARETGLCRSTLAERFTELVEQPPIQYLTQWRMQIAAGLLGTGEATVSEAAHRVGYESEAAFSRAFKKIVGVPPVLWRRQTAVRHTIPGSAVIAAVA